MVYLPVPEVGSGAAASLVISSLLHSSQASFFASEGPSWALPWLASLPSLIAELPTLVGYSTT